MELGITEQSAHDQRRSDTCAGIVPLDDTGIDPAKCKVLETVKDREKPAAQIGGIRALRIQGFSHGCISGWMFFGIIRRSKEASLDESKASRVEFVILVELLTAEGGRESWLRQRDRSPPQGGMQQLGGDLR